MRIDLSDLDRLEGIAEALGRLFWCLIAVAFFAAILGSAGTGLLVLILAAAAFVVRVGFEDFVRSRREREDRPAGRQDRSAGRKDPSVEPSDRPAVRDDRPVQPRRAPPAKTVAVPEPEFNVYRSSRRIRRKGPAVPNA